MHPIGRMGTVIDIAKGIVFLASDDLALMNGTGLVVPVWRNFWENVRF